MTPALWIGWSIALALSIGGLVILWAGLATPATAGWFAYSPMSSSVPSTGAIEIISRTTVVGLMVLAIGPIAVGFLVGVRVGQNQVVSDRH